MSTSLLARSAQSTLRVSGRRLSRQLPTAVFPTRNLFTVIHQGHEGWRLSLGRDPVKLEPGLHLAVPLYHTIQSVDMREASVNIRDLNAFTSDNVPVIVSGSLFSRVHNSYHACFSVGDFNHNVTNLGTSAVRSVVGSFTYDDVIADRNRLNARLAEVIGSSIDSWGIECTRFEIQTFKPSNREIEKQLELQMAAERERRKQILDTQALVNVAEGHKQRSILESEGALQAALNHAQGDRQSQILASEGAREAALNDARAISEQIGLIASSLADAPSKAERNRALDFLLELRRIEQLKAIASGPSNSTYFLQMVRPGMKTPYAVDNFEKWKRNMILPQSASAISTHVDATA